MNHPDTGPRLGSHSLGGVLGSNRCARPAGEPTAVGRDLELSRLPSGGVSASCSASTPGAVWAGSTPRLHLLPPIHLPDNPAIHSPSLLPSIHLSTRPPIPPTAPQPSRAVTPCHAHPRLPGTTQTQAGPALCFIGPGPSSFQPGQHAWGGGKGRGQAAPRWLGQ